MALSDNVKPAGMTPPNPAPARVRSPGAPSSALWRWRNRLVARRWTVWVCVAAVSILLCLAFVDYPLARLIHQHSSLVYHGRRLSLIPVAILAAASTGVVVIGGIHVLHGDVSPFWRRVLFAGLACCVALTLKTEAKYLFGRLPPGEWVWHPIPILQTFRPLHREGSFPSGHMTAMWSIAPFVWLRYPWLRLPWILASLGVAYALIAAEDHYASDLIGGCLLGATVGRAFLLASERRRP